MCGLFGHHFRPELRDYLLKQGPRFALFTHLLAAEMDERGGDSWGYGEWTGDNKWHEPRIRKDLGKLSPMIIDKFDWSAIPLQRLAHTRKKTTGDVTVANAHPFLDKHIFGAHNGIVYNNQELLTKEGGKWAVDSQAIFHYLARKPLEELAEVKAYGVITYSDLRKERSIYLAAFNGGSLHIEGIGKKENPLGLVWASTNYAVQHACDMLGLPHFSYKVVDGNIYYTSDEGLWLATDKLPISNGSFAASSTKTAYSSTGYWDQQQQKWIPYEDTETKETSKLASKPRHRMSLIKNETIRISRVPWTREFVRTDEELAKQACDWCDKPWTAALLTEELIMCAIHFTEYVGEEVLQGLLENPQNMEELGVVPRYSPKAELMFKSLDTEAKGMVN